jgi:deazaflavin-dependent oxidoreductase (nitroreductase family)
MDESKSRRRRRVVVLVVVWVVLRIVTVTVFRRRNPAALAAVRRFNRQCLNPVMLRLAGRRHWYAARLEHVGRSSGRSYATPVVAQPLPGRFAVPLPYGVNVDWLRNVQAAGGAELQVRGEHFVLRAPRVVPTAEIADELSPMYRLLSRVYAFPGWMVADASADGRPTVGQAPAAAARV